MKAIDYKTRGIKCDNPFCDYREETVKFEDYPLWLNKQCPKCGANLLTEKDLITLKRLIMICDIVNWTMTPFMFLFKNSKRTKYRIEMNGTGAVNFKQVND